MPLNTIKYKNNDITVVWKPDQCIHSKICWSELRAVFDPAKRPWVNMAGSDTNTIIAQIKKCPSGALSFFTHEATENTVQDHPEKDMKGMEGQISKVEIKPNGPIIIHTSCTITHSNGETEDRTGITALCRCGHSGKKPYCDGSHRKHAFEG